ncbi:hypothetical protein GCM10028796_03510 [Ramlibacter monticola]|uniref:Uncharacterized protein n=1 Tax=Ramlibacter monticola TaxID=1926872 RepID=A0A936YZ59_9BURK|nr:hypothetical protein [Ramlibacter monticola]MBL0391362.1 hypothetical protein [Ramlibacter monticola]
MPVYSKVLVVCPGNAMTAGPEALHQLVADANALGQPAQIVYHPFDRSFETPGPYRKHGAPVGRYADEPGTLILFPEIFTPQALQVRHAEPAIWWMSINNFTGVRYGRPWRDKLRYWKYVLQGKRPWGGVRALAHLRQFAQSDYARDFLAGHGLASEPLSDPIPVYTDPAYVASLAPRLAAAQRDDTILYNPTKGAAITARLMAAYPQWRFRPLRGLDREQLAQAFLDAKLYIDFGHHPGKDRLPREAAIHGCCVVTARHGSAANPVDVPIPGRFKLDVKDPQFVQRFGERVNEVFGNFEASSRELAGYRETIAQEPATFRRHVAAAFRLS